MKMPREKPFDVGVFPGKISSCVGKAVGN